MTGGTKIRLTIPRQDLSAPSQFHATPEAAAAWAQALPVAHTEPVAQRLATALAELNRVKVSPESRYQILECLRPGLDLALANLHKKYLNQPLVIPREPAATAALAEKLLASACTAYTIVAVQAIRQKDAIRDINPARLACQALQRALVFAGLRVLKAFQLYRPLPIHGWQALHQLYALGESQQLLDLPVQYSRSAETTIRATYLQAIVLGCCKPNKLRQGDLDSIYLALRDLSGLVAIGAQGDGLFIVNLDSDQPPLYSQLLPESPELEIRAIDTGALVERLRAIRVGQQDGEALPGTLEDVPGHLLDHLIDALGSMSLRNFSRTGTSAA
ncbi:MAG: hypothetical protein R3228_16920, partial [Halioglobus sp.]|nr:hypothetical protein [Halioglobus sp.]